MDGGIKMKKAAFGQPLFYGIEAVGITSFSSSLPSLT